MIRRALVGLVLVATQRPSEACVPLSNGTLELDPLHADDEVPPAAPVLDQVATWRHKNKRPGIGCPTTALMTLNVSGSDDRAPVDRLGYRLDAVGPDPAGLAEERIHDALGLQLYYYFPYDTPDFEADYELRAVDLNGNIGPPTPFHLSYVPRPEPDVDDDGACSAGGSPSWLVLVLLALLYARRDARAPA